MISENIFESLGLPNPDECLLKADLIISLRETLKKQNLTQKKAAQICETDQPTISKVLRGQMNLITAERLTRWLNRLGKDIEINIKDAQQGSTGTTTITFIENNIINNLQIPASLLLKLEKEAKSERVTLNDHIIALLRASEQQEVQLSPDSINRIGNTILSAFSANHALSRCIENANYTSSELTAEER